MGIWEVGVSGIMGGGLMSCCMLGGKWGAGHWPAMPAPPPATGGVWAVAMWGCGDISPGAPWPGCGEGVVWWVEPGGGR